MSKKGMGANCLRRLESLGERKAVELVQSRLDLMPNLPVPFGDDVSACKIGKTGLAVLKTDMLVDKTDVPTGMSLWQAARKAVVMNVSDFAAKGVSPIAMLVSLGLPKSLTDKDIEQIAAGLNAGAREYDSYVIGGDTGEASDTVISVSLFGLADKRRLVLRSGARRGDIVAVTGLFGRTSAGLKIIQEGLKAPEGTNQSLVDSVLMPHARLKEGLALCRTGSITSAIDSSDGLAWSLHEIARASNVGILIDTLPIADDAREFASFHNLDPATLALYGGEEYELIFTAKPRSWPKVRKAVEEVGGRLFRIGKVTSGNRVEFRSTGKQMLIEPRGYEHFKV